MEKDFDSTDLMGLTIQKLKLGEQMNNNERWKELRLRCLVTIEENPKASLSDCFIIVKSHIKPEFFNQ